MTRTRLKELVDRLEGISNGGENFLTQDDYGDIYTILFEKLNEIISAGWTNHEKEVLDERASGLCPRTRSKRVLRR
jgi:hypothetical protein